MSIKRSMVVGVFTTVVPLLGCSRDTQPLQSIALRDSAGVRIVENDVSRLDGACSVSAAPTVVIGGADDDEEKQLFRVFGAARLADGSIALANDGRKEVRIYERSGELRRRIGRSGRGPGYVAGRARFRDEQAAARGADPRLW